MARKVFQFELDFFLIFIELHFSTFYDAFTVHTYYTGLPQKSGIHSFLVVQWSLHESSGIFSSPNFLQLWELTGPRSVKWASLIHNTLGNNRHLPPSFETPALQKLSA